MKAMGLRMGNGASPCFLRWSMTKSLLVYQKQNLLLSYVLLEDFVYCVDSCSFGQCLLIPIVMLVFIHNLKEINKWTLNLSITYLLLELILYAKLVHVIHGYSYDHKSGTSVHILPSREYDMSHIVLFAPW